MGKPLTATTRTRPTKIHFTRIKMFSKNLITVLLVSSYAIALPLPEGESAEASAAVVDLIKSVSGVIGKTGTLVSKIAEISGSDQVKARGEEITSLADEIDAETADTITDGLQKFLEYLPEIKSNINAALDSIPGIKDEVQKQINNMPEKDTIKEHVNSLISKLPEAEGVAMFKNTVNSHIDSLPTKEAINDYIDDYVGQIPDADNIVDHAQDVVDGLNETEGDVISS